MIWDDGVIEAMKDDAVICNARMNVICKTKGNVWFIPTPKDDPRSKVAAAPCKVSTRERIIRAATNKPMTVRQLAKKTGCKQSTVYNAVYRLLMDGGLDHDDPCISERSGRPMKRYVSRQVTDDNDLTAIRAENVRRCIHHIRLGYDNPALRLAGYAEGCIIEARLAEGNRDVVNGIRRNAKENRR